MSGAELSDVSIVRSGREILSGIDLRIDIGDRWAILGLNGSGKTTLLGALGLRVRPTSGDLSVLGEKFGQCDIRAVRKQIGWCSDAVGKSIRPTATVEAIVLSGVAGVTEPWWDDFSEADKTRTQNSIGLFDLTEFTDTPFGTLSSGEARRVLLARAMVNDPELLLLDEPGAGLDFLARRRLVESLDSLASTNPQLPIVLVTHHCEEIPTSFTHAALLLDGKIIDQGDIGDVLSGDSLSDCYKTRVRCENRDGVWVAF